MEDLREFLMNWNDSLANLCMIEVIPGMVHIMSMYKKVPCETEMNLQLLK